MNFKFKNDTFLRALLRQPTEYTPMWMMRQAGRYPAGIPRDTQTRRQFLGLCKNPDFATEVTLQPWIASRWMPRSCSPISLPCRMRWDWDCIFPKAKARSSSAR